MAAKKDNTLFLFFDAINKGDYAFVDSLTDEQVKALSPFVLLMWMNGAVSNTDTHVIMTDIVCNEFVFPLAKYPRLLLKSFVAANGGIDSTRYKYVKTVSTNEIAVIKMIAKHFECGYDEAKDYLRILGDDDITELKELYGE